MVCMHISIFLTDSNMFITVVPRVYTRYYLQLFSPERLHQSHHVSVFLSLPTFAPVGVLFSVEVMSSHFALRHYVPCFFSAACGGLTFRLFSLWSGDGGNGRPDHHH